MAFTEAQVKDLEVKFDSKHVKTRQVQDTALTCFEGWHVIAEVNVAVPTATKCKNSCEGLGAATEVALAETASIKTRQIVRHEAALMNVFTKTLQTLNFMQSQRAV
jgi:hypothetical protein